MEWKNDDELFGIINSELYTAVVGDIMDKMGYYMQFLPPEIKPLKDDMVISGRAMPVVEADMTDISGYKSHNPNNDKAFGLMLDALDSLKKNDVYLCSGASPDYAVFGEIMACRAKTAGAAGAVLNGYTRDTKGMLKLGLPVFTYGNYGQDQAPRGKVIDYNVPIKIGNVYVKPGDIVIGDIDGVCIVPSEIENEVIEKALEKARGEKTVLEKIRQGMTAKEAFEKYGIM